MRSGQSDRAKRKRAQALDPKEPLQKRSQARVRTILSAANQILLEEGPAGVTAHAIAQRAQVPASSVYQFFPTKYAILVGLAEEHLGAFARIITDSVRRKPPQSWQDIFPTIMDEVCAYYEAVPAAKMLFLGTESPKEVRVVDKENNKELGRLIQSLYADFLPLENHKQADRIFDIVVEITDSLMSASVMRHGEITPFYRAEIEKIVSLYIESSFV